MRPSGGDRRAAEASVGCEMTGDGVAASRHANLAATSPPLYASTGDMTAGVVSGFEGCLSVFRCVGVFLVYLTTHAMIEKLANFHWDESGAVTFPLSALFAANPVSTRSTSQRADKRAIAGSCR